MNIYEGMGINTVPCKCQPIVMPVQECVCHRHYYVEQPVIVPHNNRIINHYIPRPTYYHTYSQSEENMCHGNGFNTNGR